jgi:hypothetical protein
MATLLGRLNEIPQRLKKFVTHDVRKNPILGLYLVIGVMVVVYGIYFIAVMYKDLTSEEEKQLSSKPQVSQVKKAPTPEKKVVAEKKPPASPPEKQSPNQAEMAVEKPETKKTGEKAQPATEHQLDVSTWKKYQFPDGPQISVPPDWGVREFSGEEPIVNGVRLHVPDSNVSLKCYSRMKEVSDHYPKILKETMKKGGYTHIKEQTKKIDRQDVVQISGTLADKIMVVNIFELQSGRYFIARLIASNKEFDKLEPHYQAIVDSYETESASSTSGVSIEKLEQQLEKSIEKKEDYLVGSTVWIKMKNGAKHTGVVIAEDDASLTLESFRFGGRYSFTVKKKDIVEIVR